MHTKKTSLMGKKKNSKKKKQNKNWLVNIWNNIHDFNKVILIGGLALNIFGVYQVNRANSIAEAAIVSDFEIAEKSGSFDKPLPYLFIGKVPMPKNYSDIKIVYGSKPNENRGFHISTIPWGITNEGKKTVEQLSINFIYHEKNALALPDTMNPINDSAIDKIQRKAFLADELPHDLITYNIRQLNPNYNISFDEKVTLIPTVTQLLIEQENGEPIKGGEIFFEQRVDAFTSAKDIETEDYTFHLTKLEVENIDSLINKYIRQYMDYIPTQKLKSTLALLSFNNQKEIDGILFDKVDRTKFIAIRIGKSNKFYNVYNYQTKRIIKKVKRNAVHYSR